MNNFVLSEKYFSYLYFLMKVDTLVNSEDMTADINSQFFLVLKLVRKKNMYV
jgi:hypothetical protein